jgi:hypothetical protein
MKNMPNVVFSPNGAHYAYVGEYARNGQGVWSVVDGRQVNFFGDQLHDLPQNKRHPITCELGVRNDSLPHGKKTPQTR